MIRRGSRNYTRWKGGKKDLASVTIGSPIIGLNDYMCIKTAGTPEEQKQVSGSTPSGLIVSDADF